MNKELFEKELDLMLNYALDKDAPGAKSGNFVEPCSVCGKGKIVGSKCKWCEESQKQEP